MLLEVVIALALCTSQGLSIHTFQYTPSDANGVLTACVGRRITIACSHDNDANGITRWLFSPPIDCSQTIDHNPPIFTRPCGPFSFTNISEIGASSFFNSSATAVASSSVSGTTVECRDSSGDEYNQIGITTICIIDQPRDVIVINGEHIIWTGTTCVGAAISYRVEVIRMNDSEPVDVIVTTSTDALLSNLQSNQLYSVSVTTIGSTCSSDPVVVNFTSVTNDAVQSPDQDVGIGVGVGIAVLLISAIMIAVIVVITVVIKIHNRPKCPGQLMENGNDVKNSEIKSQSSTEVPVKTVPATKTAHDMVLLKLNEFHEQKQGAPSLNSKLKDVNKDDQKETKPKTSHDPILPKSKDKSPSDPGGNSERSNEITEVKIEDGYAIPIPRPKSEKTESSGETSPVTSSSKAPPKPPRLRVGSTRANLSPSHHPLVDSQCLSDQEM